MLHLLTMLTCVISYWQLSKTQGALVSWRAETLHINHWDLCTFQLRCGHEQHLQSFSFGNILTILGTNEIIYTINSGYALKTHHVKPVSVSTEHLRKATEGRLDFFHALDTIVSQNMEQARHLEIVVLKLVWKIGPIFLIIIICLTSSCEESYAAILWSSF